jgi:hypothetical protein
MGQVIFDESEKPLMRMTYQGVPDEAEWERHIATMSDWARRGEVYGVVIDAREVGRIPPTQRRGIMDWITRDKAYLRANCAGGALIFASPLQQGLWTAISWVTPSPIPVKMFSDVPSAEAWVRAQLDEMLGR